MTQASDFLKKFCLSNVPDGLTNTYKSWFERYPSNASGSLSQIPWLDGAWFQLLTHELLFQLDCTVEVKDVDSTTRIPDFFARKENSHCYVEVTTVNPRDNIAVIDKNYEDAKRRLNVLKSPNFQVHLTVHGKMPQLNNKELLGPFRKLLDEYDVNKFEKYVRLVGSVPGERIRGKDWWLLGELYPVPEKSLHDSNSVDLIVDRGGSFSGDASHEVKNRLLKKAKHYGRLDSPFVIAVNVLDYRFDDWAEVATLFGPPDGVWVKGGNKPRYTRLTGVLFFREFFPWNPRGSVCLYLNPYANKTDLPESMYKLPHARWKNGSIHRVEGLNVGDLLDISLRPYREEVD